MTPRQIRARVDRSPDYGRPALALKADGAELSTRLFEAGFHVGDEVEIVPAGELERIRSDATIIQGGAAAGEVLAQLQLENTRLEGEVESARALVRRLVAYGCGNVGRQAFWAHAREDIGGWLGLSDRASWEQQRDALAASDKDAIRQQPPCGRTTASEYAAAHDLDPSRPE